MDSIFTFGDLELSAEGGFIVIKDLSAKEGSSDVVILPSEALFLLEKLPILMKVAESQHEPYMA